MPYLQNRKKYLMGQTPPPKKSFFWGGGSGALDEKDFGYVSGRKQMFVFLVIWGSFSRRNYSTWKNTTTERSYITLLFWGFLSALNCYAGFYSPSIEIFPHSSNLQPQLTCGQIYVLLPISLLFWQSFRRLLKILCSFWLSWQIVAPMMSSFHETCITHDQRN